MLVVTPSLSLGYPMSEVGTPPPHNSDMLSWDGNQYIHIHTYCYFSLLLSTDKMFYSANIYTPEQHQITLAAVNRSTEQKQQTSNHCRVIFTFRLLFILISPYDAVSYANLYTPDAESNTMFSVYCPGFPLVLFHFQ